MKPIIGVVGRTGVSKEKHKIYSIYDDISKSIYNSGGIPICITPTKNIKEILSICNGIIFQGGDEFTNYELEYLKYAYENDIPTLGICLGMQLMSTFLGGKEYNVENHKVPNKKYVHKIIINENSKLYKIINKKEIYVNSRHKTGISTPKCTISATSIDGVIEGIEDNTKRFFIGLQWHPESMISYDENSKKIFEYFINISKI